jgi:hypothetical protein
VPSAICLSGQAKGQTTEKITDQLIPKVAAAKQKVTGVMQQDQQRMRSGRHNEQKRGCTHHDASDMQKTAPQMITQLNVTAAIVGHAWRPAS